MIAACPKCDAKYRVDEAKLGTAGARLRCAKCQAVFRVRAPGSTGEGAGTTSASSQPAAPAPAPAAPQPVAPVSRPAAPPAARARPATTREPDGSEAEEQSYDRERLVLIADPREGVAKQTASAVMSWGLQAIVVHDGVEAMMSIQRFIPAVVVLDAALPKMFGFQICEIIKRNESLSPKVKAILVGAIHHEDRYRRSPSELYGADIYLEQPDLPDGLFSLLKQFGLPVVGDGPDSASSSTPGEASPTLEMATPQPAPVAAPTPEPAPRAADADDGLAEERAKAERLARIVVSDIVLYQGDKFGQAIRAGNLLEVLDSEIEEGRNFFRQRINEVVREEKDHLMEELMRVARERGMQ